MRGKSKKIEPSEDLRPASRRSPFGERLIVTALCLVVGVVPLVCLPGIFDYALLPRLFALHLCIALACLGWLLRARWGQNLSLISTPLIWPALGWGAVTLLASPATTHPLDTLAEGLNQIALLTLFFVTANALTFQALRPVLWASAGAGLTVALIGILQYHGLAFLDILSAALPSATFGNRNFAAMYLVCAAPLAGFLFLTARRRSARVLSGLSTTLMEVYLVYTRTRSAWVGVVGALLIVGGWLAFRPEARRQVLGAVRQEMDRPRRNLTVCFLALFVVLSALPAYRSAEALLAQGLPSLAGTKADVVSTAASVFQKDPGTEERLAAWSATLRMVADHPFLGVGPGGWIRAYPPYDRGVTNTTNMIMNNPHNDYLWIASEVGLVGLGVYLWFLAAGFRRLSKMVRGADSLLRIAAPMFALSLLSTLFDAFFNFPREQPQAALFLYLLFGAAASATAPRRDVQCPRPWGPLVLGLLLIVSLTALVLSLCRIGFDRGYLRAMAFASRREDSGIVLAETQRALGYGTFRPHILNLKGNALENLGRYPEAGDAYRQALALAPHSWQAHNGLCAVAIRQGRVEDALAHGQAALSLCPTFAEAHNNLGLALKAGGNLDGAIQEHQKAIRLKPDFAEAHNNLGGALRAAGDLEAAVREYRKAIDLKPDLIEAHYNLGGAAKVTGDLEAAVREYRKAIDLKPDFPEAHYNLGLALRARGDLDGAIGAYRRAVDLRPDFPEAHNNLAGALARKGDLDGAVQEYRKAIGLKPDFPEARHNLGLILKAREGRAGAGETF